MPVTADDPRYPSEWEADVVLSDGSTALVRPIRPSDGPGIVDLHARLSSETIYYRFFSPLPRLSSRQVERFTHVDYQHRFALVAVIDGRIVAVARYDQTATLDEAEVAFVVDDAYQRRGLGTLLLEHLAAAARTRGMSRLVADVLPDNQRMLGVFRDAGFERQTAFADGVTRVRLLIEPTEASAEAMAAREARADRRSIEPILRPRSVAVIGASTTPGTIGHEVFRNLVSGGFAGPVYPVNDTADHVGSVRAYPRVDAIPDDVDLAIVIVPSSAVPEVVDQCGAKGVRGLVVVTAGYAESGPAGAAAERALVRHARARGMRLVGPNCMGIVNAAEGVRLNATFAPVLPRPGTVAFSSQSGALGIAILQEAERLGIGISTFVSVGNKADVSGNDLIQYWEEDPDTEVILLYLESFGNPRKFSRIARRVSRRKPIVAVKAARTQAGLRASAPHTGAGPAPDATVDALFTHAGVIRVDTLQQLFDVAKVLADQPLPDGRSVGIVSNGGGPGILAADTCEALGLSVPELARSSQEELTDRGGASVLTAANPVRLGADAGPADYERAVRTVAADPHIDAVLAIFIPPLPSGVDAVAQAIAAGAAVSAKPVLANVIAHGRAPAALEAAHIPAFDYPEAAVHALAKVCGYAAWRREPAGGVPVLSPAVDAIAARGVVGLALADSPAGRPLADDEVAALLGACGIPAPGASALVQDEMAPPDDVVEARLLAVDDDLFGPTLTFSAGGPVAEAVGDIAARLVPLTDIDAANLVRGPRAASLLVGRGEALRHLGDAALRVSAVVDSIHEVQRVELHLAVTLAGTVIVQRAAVDVAPAVQHPEHLVRRLR